MIKFSIKTVEFFRSHDGFVPALDWFMVFRVVVVRKDEIVENIQKTLPKPFPGVLKTKPADLWLF